jgi:hypothetical protein
MRKIPDADAVLRDVLPITPFLCSREEAGIDRWQTEWTKKGFTCFVPGASLPGEVGSVIVVVRRSSRYYSIWLSDDKTANVPPLEAVAFGACSEQAADELFAVKTRAAVYRLRREWGARLPVCVISGDLRWARIQGVTEEFVEKFLILVAMVYSRANQIYAERHGAWTKEDWLNFMRRPDPATTTACVAL